MTERNSESKHAEVHGTENEEPFDSDITRTNRKPDENARRIGGIRITGLTSIIELLRSGEQFT
jgi:hypothetical protein